MSGLDLIITITDRSKCELFTNWFRGRDIPLVLTALGQGTATTEILDCLGLEASEKSVLFCLAPHSRCMVRRAARDLWLDVPGNGVLMTVPVSSIGGTSVKEYLTQNQEGEEPMEREIAHELILVIANQGHTDQVMEAARGAGAPRGCGPPPPHVGRGGGRSVRGGARPPPPPPAFPAVYPHRWRSRLAMVK